MSTRHTTTAVLAAGLLVLAGCGDDGNEASPSSEDVATTNAAATSDEATAATSAGTQADATPRFPDVVEAEVTASGDGWSVAATISSPYDSPERYADAFRVLAPDGTELGVRELLHDHAGEQPFTRSTDELAIPDDVDEVTVEGRDLANGWGGETVTVAVPR